MCKILVKGIENQLAKNSTIYTKKRTCIIVDRFIVDSISNKNDLDNYFIGIYSGLEIAG
jgi:hypothetical protein